MRVTSGSLVLLLISCCSGQVASISGQAASDPSKAHTVTGSVVNSVTGEPIRRALVQVGASFAFTGPDGHFQMDGVPDGQAYATAQKPGFFNLEGAQQSMATVGSSTNEVLVKLMPEAKLQGRIVDEDGEPIEGLQVQLMGEQIVGGRKEWQDRARASTDENGTYRIENLMPGLYLLRTEVHPVFGFRNARMTGQYRQEAYPARFYPNSPDMSAAQPLDLKPGEQGEADLALSPVRAFAVSGSVSPAPDHVGISIEDSSGQETQMGARFDRRKGRFSFLAVPAGTWTIISRSQEMQDQSYYGEQAITVGASDIEGVQVLMQPLYPIKVHVVNALEGDSPGMQVQLVPEQRRGRRGMFVATPEKENSQEQLVFNGVPPGKYNISAQPFGMRCVEAAVSGNTDLAQNELVVPAGPPAPPISITLGNDCGTVSGTVRATEGSANGTVLLVSNSLLTQPKIAQIQRGGSFTFQNLSPGEYHVYAISSIEGLEYGNAEALRDFGGQQIELGPNQKADVTLDLAIRGVK